jgi:hypothetical protein
VRCLWPGSCSKRMARVGTAFTKAQVQAWAIRQAVGLNGPEREPHGAALDRAYKWADANPYPGSGSLLVWVDRLLSEAYGRG